MALIIQLSFLGMRYGRKGEVLLGLDPTVGAQPGTERHILQNTPESQSEVGTGSVLEVIGNFFNKKKNIFSSHETPLPIQEVSGGTPILSSFSEESKFPPISDSCRLQLIGGRASDNYGAWTLCGDRLKEGGGIVYSFGIGGDVSFDNHLVEMGHTVYAFDPTIDTVKVKANFKLHNKDEIPDRFKFMQLGLSGTDGVVTFFQSRNPKIQSKTAVALGDLKVNYRDGGFQAAVLRFRTFLCMNEHRWIDVLKMDVEGVEMDVCLSEDFRTKPIPADQILIEFHERMMKDGASRKAECIKVLKGKGYKVVHMSANRQEIAFARMGKFSTVRNPDKL